MTYNIKHTDTNKPSVPVSDGIENTSELDVSLFGRTKLEYGEELNENLYHMLETFSCPESQVELGVPDLNLAFGNLLSNPTEGQKWYNQSQKRLFMWDGTKWVALGRRGDLAANWGRICHGEQLPQPVNPDGYVFPYSECIWAVSPAHYSNTFDHMVCATDETANVTMQYQLGTGLVDGLANYLIIGIKGNVNLGTQVTPPDVTPSETAPIVTPTPTSVAIPLAAVFVETQDYDPSVVGDSPRFPGYSALKWPNGVSTPSLISTANIQPWTDYGSEDHYVAVPQTYPGIHTNVDNHNYKFIFISDDGINGRYYQVTDILWGGSGHTTDGVVVWNQSGFKWLKIRVDTTGSSQHIAPPIGMFTGSTNVYRVLDASDTLNINDIPTRYDEPAMTERRYELRITGGTPPYTITDFNVKAQRQTDVINAFGSLSLARFQQIGVTGTSITGSLVPIAFDDNTTNFHPLSPTAILRPATTTAMIGPVLTGDPIVNGYAIPDYVVVNSKLALHNWYWHSDCFTFSPPNITGNASFSCTGTTDITPVSDIANERYIVTVQDSAGVPLVVTAELQTLLVFQTIDYQWEQV